MPLSLYLDDCAYSKRLAALLQQAGHTVTVPAQVGTTGKDDDVHFDYAISHNLIIVTKNPADFLALCASRPAHPGVFLIWQDNDPARDMTYPQIVAAIGNVELALGPTGGIVNQPHNLNDWRFAGPATAAPPSDHDDPPASKPPPRAKKQARREKRKKASDGD